MGYETSYSLAVSLDGQRSLEKTIIADLRNTVDSASCAIDDDGGVNQATKWYAHKDDLVEFSKKYPAAEFTLRGIGEEHDDIWVLYVKNGKSVKVVARIVFDQVNLGEHLGWSGTQIKQNPW